MKLKHLLISLACLLLLAAPAAAAGGDGTSANPYQIETAAELQSIQNDLSAHYILMNDIDLTGVRWTPIGSISAGFFGELDGNGHTISNLNLSSTAQSAGLFRSLTSGATIKNLRLEDCHVDSTSLWCGCLVGSIVMSESAHETATLQDIDMVRCSATSSTNHVGVLCGLIYTAAVVDIADCILINCEAESTIGAHVGVLCGECTDGSSTEITRVTITTSHAKTSNYNVGVLCGGCYGGSSLIMTDCNVDTCIAESTSSNYVGALCGRCHGRSSVYAENCVAENSIVKGVTNIGGIFGRSVDTGSSIGATGCTVKDCTVVATGNYAGGIAGRVISGATGVFTNCTVTDCSILANAYAAGICPAYS